MNDDVGDLHLATVVVNVQDMARAVRFWSAALGYESRESTWDPEFMMLVDPSGTRTPVSLQLAEAPPKEPVRVHLDLYTDEQDRHVERLVGMGASCSSAPAYGSVAGPAQDSKREGSPAPTRTISG